MLAWLYVGQRLISISEDTFPKDQSVCNYCRFHLMLCWWTSVLAVVERRVAFLSFTSKATPHFMLSPWGCGQEAGLGPGSVFSSRVRLMERWEWTHVVFLCHGVVQPAHGRDGEGLTAAWREWDLQESVCSDQTRGDKAIKNELSSLFSS